MANNVGVTKRVLNIAGITVTSKPHTVKFTTIAN